MTELRGHLCAVDVALCLAFALGGCAPSLGDGNDALARVTVYDDIGQPAYAGQALVQISCGNGGHCHAASSTLVERYGAPAGLDFDVRITNGQGELARLATDQRHVAERAGAIYAQVVAGTMPPADPARSKVLGDAPRYHFSDGTPLPDIATDAGREILRVWLASGSPVIESIGAPWPGTVGQIAPCEGGQTDFESCFAATQPPLRPEWPDIYSRLVSHRCGTSACHVASDAESRLDLSSEEAAYRNLVAVAAMGNACAGRDFLRVVPGEAGSSLVVQKLLAATGESSVPCGTSMPIGGSPLPRQWIEAVAQWITECATECPGPECAAPPGCSACASSETGACAGGRDDDCDGMTDCADSECAADPACTMCAPTEAGTCGNGLDDDCNGTSDCADPACAGDAACTGCTASEVGACTDGANNDCDAEGADCADSDCAADPACASVCHPSGPELCTGGVDEDCDMAIDCADPNCVTSPACTGCLMSAPTEAGACTDGIDNDCDTRFDCADSDCTSDPACAPTCAPTAPTEVAACTGGRDEDCDGRADCVDSDCAIDPACCTPVPENTIIRCRGGRDEDCDGLTDCADPDCAGRAGC